LNNDDDDENDVADFLDVGDSPLEDDLVMLHLDEILNGYVTNDDGTVYLQYGYDNIAAYYEQSTVIRLWLQSDKGGTPWQTVDSWHGWELPAGVRTVWVEGTQIGVDTIYVSWLPKGQFSDLIPLGEVAVATLGLDLDIDSDNNNGFDYPKNTDWEEYIEAHSYSIGKVIEVEASHFVPVRIRLPKGLEIADPTFQIEITGNRSDELQLWNRSKADPARVHHSVDFTDENGNQGSRLGFGIYNLAQLRYDPADGGITIWAEAVNPDHEKFLDVYADSAYSGDSFLTATWLGATLTTGMTDTVKYKSVNPDSFYPFYVRPVNRHVRNAVAADLAYGDRGINKDQNTTTDADPIGSPQLGMKVVTRDELEAILEKSSLNDFERKVILDQIYYNVHCDLTNQQCVGVKNLRIALFRDYNSGHYTLAYQGTNFFAIEDWLVNLSQSVGAKPEQYGRAQSVAKFIKELNLPGLNLTGQSLGGGFASAAALASGIYADTFNAAGLLKETLVEDAARNRFAQAGNFITSHQVYTSKPGRFGDDPVGTFGDVPDILSFMQRNIVGRVTIPVIGHEFDIMPPAVGNIVELEGRYNIESTLENNAAEHYATWIGWDLGFGGSKMGSSHLFPSIYYGLMHDGFSNRYDHLPPR